MRTENNQYVVFIFLRPISFVNILSASRSPLGLACQRHNQNKGTEADPFFVVFCTFVVTFGPLLGALGPILGPERRVNDRSPLPGVTVKPL